MHKRIEDNLNDMDEIPRKANPKAVIVAQRQRENPILQFVKNVPLEFGDISPDFILNPNTCALFLSMRFHVLYPDYFRTRIDSIKSSFRLRLLICLIDTEEFLYPLQDISTYCIFRDFTLLVASSKEEAALYLEAFKVYENKSPESIMEKVADEGGLSEMFSGILKVLPHLNKTDADTLAANFGSFKSLSRASLDQISSCPGIGEKKAKYLFQVMRQPFLSGKTGTKSGHESSQKTIQSYFSEK